MNHPVRDPSNTGTSCDHIDVYKPIMWNSPSLLLLLFVDSVVVSDLRSYGKNNSPKCISNHVYLPETHHSTPIALSFPSLFDYLC